MTNAMNFNMETQIERAQKQQRKPTSCACPRSTLNDVARQQEGKTISLLEDVPRAGLPHPEFASINGTISRKPHTCQPSENFNKNALPRTKQNGALTINGIFLGGSRPATFKSRGLVIRKADFLRGVTPSPLRHQLNA
jgi:hypothetical protein